MSKVYKYKVKQYLSEIQDNLVNEMLKYRECILVSSMGTGKTTLMEQCIVPMAQSTKDTWVVALIPSLPQLIQMESRGIETVCDGAGCSGNEMFYATTPESMHKVMSMAEKKNKRVWLIVDEAHAVVTSSDFRKSFLKIKEYAKQAEWVVRMTATPQPLEPIIDKGTFGPVFEIEKEEMEEVPLTMEITEKLTTDTVYQIAMSRYREDEDLFIHYNNIEANNLIASQISSHIKPDIKKVLLENMQQDLFGSMPKISIIDRSKKAVSLHAGNKKEKTSKALVKGEKIENVNAMCLTSVVKEGLNIQNERKTRVIIVWDKSLTFAEVLQIIGRYRKQSNIAEIVLIIKKTNFTEFTHFGFKTLYNTLQAQAIAVLDACNKTLELSRQQEDIQRDALEVFASKLSQPYFVKNDDSGLYEIDEELFIGFVYKIYCNSLKKSPKLVERMLREQIAVKLKVNIHMYNDAIKKDLQVELKASALEKKEMLQDLLKNKIFKYDDDTINEIIEHRVNPKLPEMQEAFQAMTEYHQLSSPQFKNDLKQMVEITGMNNAKALKELVNIGLAKYKPYIKQKCAIAVNIIIRELGIKTAEEQFICLKQNNKTVAVARQVAIRKYLMHKEAMQCRLTNKLLDNLLRKLVEERFYPSYKTTNKRIESVKSSEEKERLVKSLHEKSLAKVRKELMQDLEIIYNLTNDSSNYTKISSVKYTITFDQNVIK